MARVIKKKTRWKGIGGRNKPKNNKPLPSKLMMNTYIKLEIEKGNIYVGE